MGILDPAPRMATVRTLTPIVRVLTVHGADFRALLARDSSASIGIIRLLIHRQRDFGEIENGIEQEKEKMRLE